MSLLGHLGYNDKEGSKGVLENLGELQERSRGSEEIRESSRRINESNRAKEDFERDFG